jgi:hypothetical protein
MKSILILILTLGLVNCTEKKEPTESSEKNPHIPFVDKPVYCIKYDLTEFLNTEEEFGTDGVFDTMFQRIQIHFETIARDSIDGCVYHILGADRLKGLATPFKGEIKIFQIVEHVGNLYEPEVPSDDRLINFYGSYKFEEQSSVAGAGIFEGRLTIYMTLNSDNRLVDDIGEYMGDSFTNFTYQGTWTSYKTGQTKTCTWGQGRLPDTGDFDVGAGALFVNDKYKKNGWQKDENNIEYLDNPKNWWASVLSK